MKIDIIGDVHGCLEELEELLFKLGYQIKNGTYQHSNNRQIVFVGDITDRGPDSIKVIKLVYQLVKEKLAYYIPGNHCNKLYRFFQGNKVMEKHGLETTTAEYRSLSKEKQNNIKHKFIELYERSPLYLHLKNINVIIAHAGIPEHLIGKKDKRTKTFVLYGDITGEFDTTGKPIRRDWAKHYHGDSWIVYGHTPVLEPRVVNHTINIDTGCVFGNKLTAYRFPEKEFVSVASRQPFIAEKFTDFNVSNEH
ncbi:bis(5'-nucleosyl)-tetraphosphatase PrpE [Oceanobacillus iheyensis]|uniref:Bis(5'-nucleosyl)-tetraphosphatase PrpE [asymmetrical] n=1 Tax=Oceanobacillus iheyensis (strain DSM 14371 / CIP 107618 / JCM 11309 / KCTC 3954 / HTE831) TaxID=221109 RepID=PRPE_OCEIH|nr:bis(5'-nucleosyl)-tetraphosphatase PrpE [Oceanobacillus iheyensis]Q8ERS7.1 RecName: Full=Bis(5'-nucleosyl)-tetraphosphatase PrpE [asymmetrical]; AltName: Full=Ap4A hydrolase; AltName: Full=Diadenosine 5',5'''-P1,P4-tetraphosphate asymmetrical hydrolase; Short=Diadenosine tetraphosphatase [Oceanobacillus iheyensis HTE831]BAC13179.1 diadenosine tetraphosphatase [Oceanobacillus iheyensis HTE831]